MSIRRGSLIAATLVPVMTLAACGGGDSGGAAAEDGECGSVSLRLSHQWPAATGGEDSDFRSELAQQFADKVAEETDDQVKVQIFPAGSLVESTEQYDAAGVRRNSSSSTLESRPTR